VVPRRLQHAAGLLGLTRGATDLGVAGESGSEAVAIVRNPRPLATLASARPSIAAHLALTVPITLSVHPSAREANRADRIWKRYGGGNPVTLD
jgi:hypothetical protein